MTHSSESEYKNLFPLVIWLNIAIFFNILLAAAGVVIYFLQIQFFSTADTIMYSQLEELTKREEIWTFISAVVYLFTLVLFFRWIYFSTKNVRSFGIEDLRYSPGWTIVWYFIPIFSYWKPYVAIKEVFQASNPYGLGHWKDNFTPLHLRVWWFFVVISSLLGNFIGYWLYFKEKSIENLLTFSWLYCGYEIFYIPVLFLTLKVIWHLQSLQAEKIERLSRQSFQASQEGRSDW